MDLDVNAMITRSQYGFVRNKSCQVRFGSFSNGVASLMNGLNVVDIIYLNVVDIIYLECFSKVFNKMTHNI